jgi:hypothetical protein
MLPPKIDPSFNPLPPSQEQSFYVNLRPLGSVAGAKKFDFSSGKNSELCIDLSKTELMVKFRLLTSAGKVMDDLDAEGKEKLGLINNVLGSLFSGLTVYLNNQVVSQCSNHHYSSYISSLLNYTSSYQSSILSAAGWSDVSLDSVGTDTAFAYNNYKDQVLTSGVVTVKGRIQSPIFLQEKLLPPNVELTVSLLQNDPKIFVYTNLADMPTVEILDCQLSLRYIKLKPSLLQALTSSLISRPYLINFARTEIRTFALAKGMTRYSAHNIHFGKIPSRTIAFFVSTDNYQGKKDSSPYKLTNVNLKDHRFIYNSVNLPPTKIEYDMSKKAGVELYFHVCKQLGLDVAGPTPNYSYGMFSNDTFLLAQSFTSDVSVSEATTPGMVGSIGLELDFASALEANVTMLLYSQYDDGLVTIDKDTVTVS